MFCSTVFLTYENIKLVINLNDIYLCMKTDNYAEVVTGIFHKTSYRLFMNGYLCAQVYALFETGSNDLPAWLRN